MKSHEHFTNISTDSKEEETIYIRYRYSLEHVIVVYAFSLGYNELID